MADISKIERKGILYNIKDTTARNLLQQKYTVPIGGIPKEDLSLEVQNLLQAAKTAMQSYTETDPTVPAWAKAVNKPTYTAEEVGALPSTTHIPVDPVNADWNASSGLALILNKPALFSGDYNDLINKPVIPSGYDDTVLSGRITALENAGFITQESDPTVPSWAKASTKPSYTASEVGALPADTVIPVIPTNVSSFVNDVGYLTQHLDISGKANISDLAAVATSGSYNDLSDTPDVPIAISVNEQSFVMNQFHAFVIPDYYTKTLIDNAGYVTSSDVADAVADLVDSAPSTLDTLNELAAALGDDPNFATTIATALGNKVDKEVGKGLFSGSYNDLTNKPNIPSAYDDTALSNRVTALENAGFLTSETDPNVPAWAKAATKPSYTASEVGALPDTTVIPTATSQLTNDSGFLTTHQDISGKQDVLTAGDGIAIDANDTIRTTGIPFGVVDSTSTSTAYTVTVPGIYKLEDGVCCLVKNGKVTSESGFTLNVNGLGAKPSYNNMATGNPVTPTNPTRDTTIFNINYTMLFIYSETLVDGGAWICYRGYDANTNTIGYQVRSNSHSLPASQKFYRYRLLFTSADGTHYVPANTSSSTNATSSRTVNQTPIDPFGHIVYYGTTAAVEANARPAASSLWVIYTLSLGYSFNRTGAALTLDDWAPVYLKCAPQANGSAIIDADTPYVQSLPTTADGKIYIFLGVAYNATSIELLNNHPVYYHDGTGIRIWTGKTIPSKTSELTNDSGFVASTSLATVATSGSYNDLTDKPTIPTAATSTPLMDGTAAVGSSSKYAKEDHVHPSDTSRVPTSRTINSKALTNDITLTASDIGAVTHEDLSGYAPLRTDDMVDYAYMPHFVLDGINKTIPSNPYAAGWSVAHTTDNQIAVRYQEVDGLLINTGYNYYTPSQYVIYFNKEDSKFYRWTGSAMVAISSTVAYTGSYNDLADKPTIPAAVTVDSSITSGGTNPVQGGAIYSALQRKTEVEHISFEYDDVEDTFTFYDSEGNTITDAEFRDICNSKYVFLFDAGNGVPLAPTKLEMDSWWFIGTLGITDWVIASFYWSSSTNNLDGDYSYNEIVPTTRKINNKPLSTDVTLTASDVNAQAVLVSGTNIKTINSQSLLGEGNLTIASGSDGVGIASVVQTTTSNTSGGNNIITVTKTDGSSSTFTVKNGVDGANGVSLGEIALTQETGDSTSSVMSQAAVTESIELSIQSTKSRLVVDPTKAIYTTINTDSNATSMNTYLFDEIRKLDVIYRVSYGWGDVNYYNSNNLCSIYIDSNNFIRWRVDSYACYAEIKVNGTYLLQNSHTVNSGSPQLNKRTQIAAVIDLILNKMIIYGVNSGNMSIIYSYDISSYDISSFSGKQAKIITTIFSYNRSYYGVYVRVNKFLGLEDDLTRTIYASGYNAFPAYQKAPLFGYNNLINGLTLGGTVTQTITSTHKIISATSASGYFGLAPKTSKSISYPNLFWTLNIKLLSGSISIGRSAASVIGGVYIYDSNMNQVSTIALNTTYLMLVGALTRETAYAFSYALSVSGTFELEVWNPNLFNIQTLNICVDTWDGEYFTGTIPFKASPMFASTTAVGSILISNGNILMWNGSVWKQINNS